MANENKALPNMRVAYHDGPPAITFFGMDWTRERPQEVTPKQWEGMQLRADFKEFDFRVSKPVKGE